jgi:tetrahydroxynaphthalene reductase
MSPLTRCGYPNDVARVVYFLASNEAEWINGKVIEIDCGAA